MKLLVIDDADAVIEAATICLAVQWRGAEVIGAYDGESGLDLVERERPDLVLLDITMPGLDGFETLRSIRAFSDVPVIMLTAMDDVVSKIKGLELGADDYVTKPFDHLELLARIRAVLRRLDLPPPITRTPSFRSGDLTVDFASHEVRLREEVMSLTPTEYKLLYHFVRNPNQVLRHQTLLARVWGGEYVDDIEYLRAYVRRLRRKLEDDPERPRHILTERGLGYRFHAEK
jgi:two-component system KDP operon response regulator KdpE